MIQRALADSIGRLLKPLQDRVRLAISRAVLRLVFDEHGVQLVQVSALRGEVLGKVPRLSHFGFTSYPPPDTEAVLVCPGASRDQAVVIAEEHRASRPLGILVEGEAILYSSGGARVLVRADGSVLIKAAAGVQVSDDLEAGGDLVAGGQVEDLIGTLDELRQAFNVHVHADPQGGTTGPPNNPIT